MAEPLYLKYRPQKLAELVGQEIIAITLGNALKLNRMAHAYFFTGPRGCGKTSTARILAKSLDCQQGPTIDPCGVCLNCKEIALGISPDVIEIDAASHRSVEDAAQVIERCHLASQTSSYKIYIFDEVHMLSKEAFNALLKTIEEPPPNVIFILATTEEHKVPATIVSRCQKFSFKPIEMPPLMARLKQIAEIENIKLIESSFAKIAKQSKGGLRDALSLLDQISILGISGEVIEEKLILDLFGALSEQALDELLTDICQKKTFEALDKINDFLNNGADALQLLRALLEFAIEKLEKKTNENYDSASLIQVIDNLSKGEYSLRTASQPALRLKSLILANCLNSSASGQMANIDLNPLIKRIELLENKTAHNTNLNSSFNPPSSALKENKIAQTFSEKTNSPNQNNNSHKSVDNAGLIDILINELSHIPTKTLIRDSKAFIISQTDDLAVIGVPLKGFFDKLNDAKKIKLIQDMLSEKLGKTLSIRFELNTSQKPPQAEPATAPALIPIIQAKAPEPAPKLEIINNIQTESNTSINEADNENDENSIMDIAQHILGAKPIDV